MRGVEVEDGARRSLAARLAERVTVEMEPVLSQHAVADGDGARGDVVVVVAGVLLVEPADQPNVDMGVAVELGEVALVGVVADEVFPETPLAAEAGGDLDELGPVEVPSGGKSLDEEGSDVVHSNRRVGLSRQSASATA